ncbi:hypothetical protein JCM1840_003169 [Sporobolomyces johnsonii]
MSSLLHHKSVRVHKPTRGHQASPTTGEVRPDHELIDRLQQWKHIDKSLLHYYKGLADIEHAASKSTHALTETIQVPFHEGHGFLGEGGWQEVFYEIRDDTKLLAETHSTFADTIERTVVKELEGVRSELKAHIAAIGKEASTLADEVEKERQVSTHHLTELQTGIDTFENSSVQMLPQKDPYLSHNLVLNQLKKQVLKENDLQLAMIRFQQQQPAFEENIARSIQSATKLYEDARLAHTKHLDTLHLKIASALQRVEPTAEWNFFASRPENSLIDPNTPTRSVDAINFPGMNHGSTQPLKEGYLERKKRFTKKYTESYYVLTPSGYLHERKSSNHADTAAPGFSLFLPECSLGPPAKETDRSHKFHVEGNKAVRSSFESKMKNTLRFGGKEIAYTFRARTHAEMLGWWEECDRLSRDTKTATESHPAVVQRDPVAAAVTNIGYAEPDATTAETASTVAAVPGDRVLEGEEAEAAVAPSNKSVKSVTVVAPTTEGAVDGVAAHDHVEEDDSEEGGGSSEEEYDSGDELAIARTAPSTPAPGTGLAGNPLDNEEAVAKSMKAETLPAYHGTGVSAPEKAALVNEHKGAPPPILGEPVLGNSGAAASTSTAA